MRTIALPELAVVVLIGPSGAGKSTFARKHFKPTEILSSDALRGWVRDDEQDQDATRDAFDVLAYVAAKRLAAGKLVVVDATSVQPEARKPLVQLAKDHHVFAIAIVLDTPTGECVARNALRPDRPFGAHVVRNQRHQLDRSLRGLEREGFRSVHVITPAEADAITVTRQRLWTNRRDELGPFDIIGDVHGCLDELRELLGRLGYQLGGTTESPTVAAPAGRRAIFLGDLVDRGPAVPGVLRLVMHMVQAGTALCVPGNHELKLLRHLQGKQVKLTHGLDASVTQLAAESSEFRAQVAAFIDELVSHFVLDEGRLVVAHAGMKEPLQGRASGAVRQFALFGETTGETDEYGLPVRHDWAREYRGRAAVVYGHTPTLRAEWLNGTICIDTGCVFGGQLTALRWPERELVAVAAKRVYVEPARPLSVPAGGRSAQHEHDDVLDLADVIGKRAVHTELAGPVTVREDRAAPALELMARFAVDPRWLIYLPPTMSPVAASALPGTLEHPAQAFDYFREHGVTQVVCQEKHMGSRALVIVCRDDRVARERFGVTSGESGAVYTRTGRRFFTEPAWEAEQLARLRERAEHGGFWDSLRSDWALLDCELMPWSLKAQALIDHHYAPVAVAGRHAIPPTLAALEGARGRGLDVGGLLETFTHARSAIERYDETTRRYAWPVAGLDDVRLAPFHLLASEGAAHHDKPHAWHLSELQRLVDDRLIVATPHHLVSVGDAAAEAEVTAWWETRTLAGAEGMVVKPATFVTRAARGLVQPALKVRGREYLRLIYGPLYDAPGRLEQLRERGLGSKRGLAQREFALGIEGLQRFVRREPLRRVHECVFAVLALETEPLDPRL